jgi:Flp pilus assembly protein TadD
MAERRLEAHRAGVAKDLLTAAALFLVVAAVFWPAIGNGFLVYDDSEYVTENVWVSEGLTLPGIGWAATTLHAGNWHPLTWISHMADATLFGMRPAGHHLVSVLLHAASTALLFLFLRAATGARWPSALASALFGVHPLHVESVAWVSERKDVLSALFWMLSLLAYLRYLRKPGAARYAALLAAYVLGTLSKPMVLTLPFVLLILDFWPCGRWRSGSALGPLLREKSPLFAWTVVPALLTWVAQSRGGAVGSAEEFPLALRAANALVAAAAYLGKTVLPGGLAVVYPHPQALPSPGTLLLATGVLAGASLLALGTRRSRPYLLAGWLWYACTLAPVIGLVQVGRQGMADRYTYLPLIGIFAAASWGGRDLLARRAPPGGVAAVVALLLAFLARSSTAQLAAWRDDEALMTHAVAVTGRNWLAHFNLGVFFERRGREAESRLEFARAWDDYRALRGAGGADAAGRDGAAAPGTHGEPASGAAAPDAPAPAGAQALNAEAVALLGEGRFAQAAERCREALRLAPGYLKARNNLGVALSGLGDLAAAAAEFRAAAAIDPGRPEALVNLGNVLARSGDLPGALESLRRAVAADPESIEARLALGAAYGQRGAAAEALFEYREALRLDPRSDEARRRVGTARDRSRAADPEPAAQAPAGRYLAIP